MAELTTEIAAYELLRNNLEANHFGEWALIHDEELVGTYGRFEDAADIAVQRFGRGPYLSTDQSCQRYWIEQLHQRLVPLWVCAVLTSTASNCQRPKIPALSIHRSPPSSYCRPQASVWRPRARRSQHAPRSNLCPIIVLGNSGTIRGRSSPSGRATPLCTNWENIFAVIHYDLQWADWDNNA